MVRPSRRRRAGRQPRATPSTSGELSASISSVDSHGRSATPSPEPSPGPSGTSGRSAALSRLAQQLFPPSAGSSASPAPYLDETPTADDSGRTFAVDPSPKSADLTPGVPLGSPKIGRHSTMTPEMTAELLRYIDETEWKYQPISHYIGK